MNGRNPQNRRRNWTGTVHWAIDGKLACGPVATHDSYLTPSIATVTCRRCIALQGGDVTGYIDPPPVQTHVARRAAERAARRESPVKGSPVNDAPKTDAQAAAEALIAAYGEPQSRDTLRDMLALAYAVGAKTAATEAAAAVKSA